MAMTETFTIAQLLYGTCPSMQFRKLTSDLAAALGKGLGCAITAVRETDSTAAYELPGLRLVLDYRSWGRRGFDHCLVVATGPSEDRTDDTCIDPTLRTQLVKTIVKRITSRYPADRQDWSDCPGALTEEGFEDALDALTCDPPLPVQRPQTDLDRILGSCAVAGSGSRGRAPANAMPPMPPRMPTSAATYGNAALALATPQAAAAVEIANTDPMLSVPEEEAVLLQHEALRQSAPDPEEKSDSLALRLAAHTMNATVLVLSLPVGGAMMTHAALRGANVNTSGRALAMVGTMLGFAHLFIGSQLGGIA
jgi:hypothetical protein